MNRHSVNNQQAASFYHNQYHQHPLNEAHLSFNQHQHSQNQYQDNLFASSHLQRALNAATVSNSAAPTSPLCSSAPSLSPILNNEFPPADSKTTTTTTTSSTKKNKSKKARTMFSNYQLTMFETTFQQSPYPDAYIRRNLANRLGLDVARVQVWFQNRRAKWRKKAAARAQFHQQQAAGATLPIREHSPVDIVNMV